MSQEAAQIPRIIKNVLEHEVTHNILPNSFPPQQILTIAHGSSAAAVSHFARAIEDFGPGRVYHCDVSTLITLSDDICLKKTWLIIVSQSGMSPDLSLAAQRAKERGAFVIAFINKSGSRLQSIAHITVPIGAEEEKAVPATKSFVASIITLIQWWLSVNPHQAWLDTLLNWGLELEKVDSQQWQSAVDFFTKSAHAFVLSPFHSKAIADEMALKLKECTLIHAQSFTLAEFAHGPMALLSHEAPLLVLLPNENAFHQALDQLKLFDQTSNSPLLIACHVKLEKEFSKQLPRAVWLPIPTDTYPWLDVISSMLPFYSMVEKIAQILGLDPDDPPFLKKETKTK